MHLPPADRLTKRAEKTWCPTARLGHHPVVGVEADPDLAGLPSQKHRAMSGRPYRIRALGCVPLPHPLPLPAPATTDGEIGAIVGVHKTLLRFERLGACHLIE